MLNFFVILSDINECEDHLNNCKNKLDCENTEGGYNCEKRKSKLKIVIVGMSLYLLNYQDKYKTKYTPTHIGYCNSSPSTIEHALLLLFFYRNSFLLLFL